MFDARLHPHALSDADLETLRQFGVTGALIVGAEVDEVDAVRRSWDASLRQRDRLTALGFEVVLAVGIPCGLGAQRGLAALLRAVPEALGRAAVLGPLTLSRGSIAETQLCLEQLELAHEFARPVLVSAPTGRHEALTAKTLALVRKAKLEPSQVLVDGLGLKTVRSVLARRHWAGLTLHPSRLDVDVAERLVHALGPARLVLGSGAGEGQSDLLALPRLVSRLKHAKLTAAVVSRVSERNLRGWLGRAR